MAKKQSAGKAAMFREAKAKQAQGKPHHTRMINKPKANEFEQPYPEKPKAKGKKKKGPGKGNVPNSY